MSKQILNSVTQIDLYQVCEMAKHVNFRKEYETRNKVFQIVLKSAEVESGKGSIRVIKMFVNEAFAVQCNVAMTSIATSVVLNYLNEMISADRLAD